MKIPANRWLTGWSFASELREGAVLGYELSKTLATVFSTGRLGLRSCGFGDVESHILSMYLLHHWT